MSFPSYQGEWAYKGEWRDIATHPGGSLQVAWHNPIERCGCIFLPLKCSSCKLYIPTVLHARHTIMLPKNRAQNLSLAILPDRRCNIAAVDRTFFLSSLFCVRRSSPSQEPLSPCIGHVQELWAVGLPVMMRPCLPFLDILLGLMLPVHRKMNVPRLHVKKCRAQSVVAAYRGKYWGATSWATCHLLYLL